MAARIRASFTDDDSISDHLTVEMVRINAPLTTTSMTTTNNSNNDLDEQTTMNDSVGTPATNDFLSTSNPGLTEGVNPEYEVPNICTFKKVIKNRSFYFSIKSNL